MKTEIKEIYKCDFCNKLYQIKKACVIHEKGCKKRPDYLRPCHSCQILTKKTVTVESFYYGCDISASLLYCDKLKTYIYPPSVATKGNQYDTNDITNIEMPKECEHHTNHNYIENN